MSKTDPEYMRAYRARKKAEQKAEHEVFTFDGHDLRDLKRISELEAEVKHLKAELAQRAVVAGSQVGIPVPGLSRTTTAGFNTRGFTPAPKKGK